MREPKDRGRFPVLTLKDTEPSLVFGFYIISYWNDCAPWNGLHTVAVYYDGTRYITYNRWGNGKLCYENPAEYAGEFIIGYYIGRVSV